ncbi:hypothetical protein NQ317_009161 [Molorchus minor]|uniref:Uncharacterized protein n=1 Tax=Molorchus minor TaxID=1323400 RepID=A0ABQ9JZF1_9CUCU|nr:hypothetical protein NQ317_009161 [Molorchus minor]
MSIEDKLYHHHLGKYLFTEQIFMWSEYNLQCKRKKDNTSLLLLMDIIQNAAFKLSNGKNMEIKRTKYFKQVVLNDPLTHKTAFSDGYMEELLPLKEDFATETGRDYNIKPFEQVVLIFFAPKTTLTTCLAQYSRLGGEKKL